MVSKILLQQNATLALAPPNLQTSHLSKDRLLALANVESLAQSSRASIQSLGPWHLRKSSLCFRCLGMKCSICIYSMY